MENLESQIAKIQIGNIKSSSSITEVSAERAGDGHTELYVVAELTLLNPAARQSCENILAAISASLRRYYQKPSAPGQEGFENAVAEVNDELSKLASLGEVHWLGRLNCILAAKNNSELYITTTGKVACFLLRKNEFTDITCSGSSLNPLKTFENVAAGKLRLSDIIILSSSQLLNYISIEKTKTILESVDFLAASKLIIDVLKNNADPETSIGSLFNKQVLQGQTPDQEIDLETYSIAPKSSLQNFISVFWQYIKQNLLLKNSPRAVPSPLPSKTFFQKIKSAGFKLKRIFHKSKAVAKTAAGIAIEQGRALHPQNIKTFSGPKKFLLASILFLILAAFLNIYISSKVKNSRQKTQAATVLAQKIQTDLDGAESALLYNDEEKLAQFLTLALTGLKDENISNLKDKDLLKSLQTQAETLSAKLEKTSQVNAENLGNLAPGESLISVPDYLAAYNNNQIISYGLKDNLFKDGLLKSPAKVIASIFVKDGISAIYTGESLIGVNLLSGQSGNAYINNLPSPENFAGLAIYGTNGKIYVADKKAGQIVSFNVSLSEISKPIVSVKDPDILKNARDIAIDGSIWVLLNDRVAKFHTGARASFNMPFLPTALSGQGRIFTQSDFANLYIMDAGNQRILIINKNGSLVATLKNNELKDMKDIFVVEKDKTIYILNSGSLYKMKF